MDNKNALIRALSEEFPESAILQRKGSGGMMLSYISGGT